MASSPADIVMLPLVTLRSCSAFIASLTEAVILSVKSLMVIRASPSSSVVAPDFIPLLPFAVMFSVPEPERVTCETELIALIRSKAAIEAGGVLYGKTAKDKMGPAHKILTYSFWFYNKGGALLKKHKRTLKGKIENPATPIDPIEIPYLHNIKKQK